MMKWLVAFVVFLSSWSWAGVERSVAQDLTAWRDVMEMFVMDDGRYPEFSSIEALAREVYQRQYWEEPIISDPSGRPYQVSSSRSHFRIWTVDNAASIENGFKLPEIKAEPKSPTPPPTLTFPAPRSPDTALYVTKSGNDIRLDWTGAGTQYDGSLGADPRFSYVRTLFTDSTASSYLYANGLLKYDETFLCFDVTDEVEVNHGGYWNGGLLPPPPPTIDTGSPTTNIGSLYDGSTGTIVGTGFSTTPAENFICFDGGVCTPATSATSTQVQFTTPPGAVSGDITVQVGPRVSDPASAVVTLEDPALGWSIRSIGYAHLTADYWMAGNGPNGNSLYRMYYDTGTQKWLKEHRSSLAAQLLYCSTQTTQNGYYYCGYATNSTGGGGTRKVDTDDAGSNLTGGVNLGGSGVTSNVRGAAADPNPDGVAGRDVGYFAHAISGSNLFYIKKVDETSSTVLDSNYGGYNWSPNWGAIVGLTVDPTNGDLYVGTLTNISKIDTSENITAVKGGFTNIYGLDIFRQNSNDPGFLIVADAGSAGAGSLKAIALDNTSAAPITVANVTNIRTANWGGLVFNAIQPGSANALRKVVVHNNNNSGAVLPVKANPFIGVAPSTSSDIWISAPPPEGGPGTVSGPAAQAYTRAADTLDTSYSRSRIVMWYKDDKARETTAYVGDPGKATVGYEPAPADLSLCDKPRELVAGICDNKDDLVANGVGAFYETGRPLHHTKTCGSFANRCYWENNITRRYAGDNYKVYFRTGDYATQTYFASASPIFSAVKHLHIENDRMCLKGGILAQDFNGAACVPWNLGDPLCEAVPNPANLKCNELRLFNWVNLQADDAIKLFDSSVPFETTTQTAIYNSSINLGDGTSIICLKDAGGNGINFQGQFSASASGPPAGRFYDFSVGNSAGVCLNSSNTADYYIADLTDLRQAYDEGFVNYHVAAYGTEGAGVVPYLPTAFCDDPFLNHEYFHQLWFKNKKPVTGQVYDNDPHNYFHVLGSGNCASAVGQTDSDSDFMYIYIQVNADECTAYGCTPTELGNYIRMTVSHECGHCFRIDSCTSPVSHCSNNAWCGGAGGGCPSPCTGALEWCVMNGATTPPNDVMCQRVDGIDRFDCSELSANPSCPVFDCSGGISIRTDTDPE